MIFAIVVVFALSYAAIALEYPLGISKSASALLGAGLLWAIYALGIGDPSKVVHELNETIATTAQVIFFLLGAMTIVEVIDAHDGFKIVTSRIRTNSLVSLLWLVSWLTFFLSAILDNLTTTIVMASLMRKLLANTADRLLFVSVIVIAANAGGAWSPIGDVTTTMLWIGGQVSALGIVYALFPASIVCLTVPLVLVSLRVRGRNYEPPSDKPYQATKLVQRNLIFGLGLSILIAVPAFKQVTHLPPFMGVLLGLGILWFVGELVHRADDAETPNNFTVTHALARIDHASLLFFVGILLAVATLEHTHILAATAAWLDRAVGRLDVIVLVLGLLSAVVDNVPLVAAAMAMYSIQHYPPDSFLWEFLAYCAGTGGSILIIGSAAGVAAMGIEKIQFFWYARYVAAFASLGYLAGAAVYVVQFRLSH